MQEIKYSKQKQMANTVIATMLQLLHSSVKIINMHTKYQVDLGQWVLLIYGRLRLDIHNSRINK